MEPHFLKMEKKGGGIGLNFITGNNKEMLDWSLFPDDDSVKIAIRKLKRRCESEQYGIYEENGDFRFVFLDRSGQFIARSRTYSRRQRTLEGVATFFRLAKDALTYTKSLDGDS